MRTILYLRLAHHQMISLWHCRVGMPIFSKFSLTVLLSACGLWRDNDSSQECKHLMPQGSPGQNGDAAVRSLLPMYLGILSMSRPAIHNWIWVYYIALFPSIPLASAFESYNSSWTSQFVWPQHWACYCGAVPCHGIQMLTFDLGFPCLRRRV